MWGWSEPLWGHIAGAQCIVPHWQNPSLEPDNPRRLECQRIWIKSIFQGEGFLALSTWIWFSGTVTSRSRKGIISFPKISKQSTHLSLVPSVLRGWIWSPFIDLGLQRIQAHSPSWVFWCAAYHAEVSHQWRDQCLLSRINTNQFPRVCSSLGTLIMEFSDCQDWG